MRLLLGIAISAVAHGAYGASSSPPVQVELRSSWPAPPALFESIETICIEEPDAFFPLLDVLTNPELQPEVAPRSEKEWHQYALDTAVAEGYLSAPGAHAAVEMELALHSASPKLEAYFQFYQDRDHLRREAGVTDADCDSWVDWYGQVACDTETLAHLAGVETIDPPNVETSNTTLVQPKLLPFDHVLPSPLQTPDIPPRTAILYGLLESSNFRDLHSWLHSAASGPSPSLQYVFRPIPPRDHNTSKPVSLSGYGVALDLKKMDYLALDDRRQGGSEHNAQSDDVPELDTVVDPVQTLIQQYPENETYDATIPLTPDELLEIGFQATQLISEAEEPLSVLKQLVQNFPKYATTLARRVAVDLDLVEELSRNQIKAQGGVSMAWLNGVVVPENEMNPFALLRLLRKERNIMLSLMSLGLSPEQAIRLLTHPTIGAAQSDSGVLDGLYDASDRPEGGDVIVWMNDIEKDPRYERWGSSLRILLRPMYPGSFPAVKQNLFNIVLATDLSHPAATSFVAVTVSNLINRNLPFRFGVVPLLETDDSVKMARLFYHLEENYGPGVTMSFLRSLNDVQARRPSLTTDWFTVRAEFNALVEMAEPLTENPETDLTAILDGKSESWPGQEEKARAYARRLGATLESSPFGHVFVNGKPFDLDDEFLRHMQLEVGQQLQHVQEQLAAGVLSDSDGERISTYFYDLPTTIKRRNQYVYPSSKSGSLRIVDMQEAIARASFPSQHGSYIYPVDSEKTPLTTFVVGDFNAEDGLLLLKEALDAMTPDSLSRLGVIHNPQEPPSPGGPPTASLLAYLAITGTLSRVPHNHLSEILQTSHVTGLQESAQVVLSPEAILAHILQDTAQDVGLAQANEAFMKTSRLMLRELELSPGELALVVNGRVVGPLNPRDFAADDFTLLWDYELRKRVEPVVAALEEVEASFDNTWDFEDVVLRASSIISSLQLPDPSEVGLFNAPQRPRRRNYQLLDGRYSTYTFGDNTTALYHFGVILDPLSETAQKWTAILEWALNMPGVYVELHLNPGKYNELPIKRFYRYNLRPRLDFDSDGVELETLTTFTDLPIEPLYTLAMDVPQAWLVRPREAEHDLDNIQLSTLSAGERRQGVRALFALDHLVVEGHARDTVTGAPPRGVQLQLMAPSTEAERPIADTLVMANLGYLQFRTSPGIFRLEIRPGRGRDIFTMESVGNEGWNSPTVDDAGDEITVASFEGVTVYPRLVRKPGMERADVLAETIPREEKEHKGVLGDVMSRVSSIFGHHGQEEHAIVKTDSDEAEINIFTVASGLLYERFASIMILSVLRNTNSSVKFWFIENFLSPSFLEFIPHFAREYNFSYSLVTYKWPSWLRQQHEKQRIIWAYKILFLDVLFPMDLKRVIFVDADQIVRADLAELVHMDIQGAPYAYTPMGDDNTDMEGFRFWKTGYWRDALRGRPYHISALYLVDLVRFRQLAAGDILRSHYQALSADPNSLANLDQDLPNNLQFEVPIFSLPEDWLWCETWCSKERLDRAKTIDLCQNPLTKEPKLSRARQIPEWEEYDAEIAAFARSLTEQGRVHSGIVAADVGVLAEGTKAKKADDTPEHQNPDAGEEKVKGTTEETASDPKSEHLKDEL
ncbi:glycosyltransferase family 24 protein [Obba rivulosa]|uniref:Glycosyltransferase family 24 protein n=1 Tax=Obba rivulosa TaxID=1052685 RepID=A0A8E2J3U8_9APHY|nr:glycosyltransferase family 24 protein [Obba rivulosa]